MLLIILFVIIVLIILLSLTIVPQNNVGLVETFGKYSRTIQAGLNFVIPVIQRVRKVSLALQPLSLDPYSVITKDNAEVQVSVTLNYLVNDPVKYFYNNTNSEESMAQLVRGHLRDIIGKMDLNEALGETSKINDLLFRAIDSLTSTFGIRVIRINIDELDPSEEIQRAMDQQLTADRRKQAQILEAEGNARQIELETKAKNDAVVSQAKAQAEAKRAATDAEAYRINEIQRALATADDNYFKNQSINAFTSLAYGNNDMIVMDQNKIDELGNVPVVKKMLGLDGHKSTSADTQSKFNSQPFSPQTFGQMTSQQPVSRPTQPASPSRQVPRNNAVNIERNRQYYNHDGANGAIGGK